MAEKKIFTKKDENIEDVIDKVVGSRADKVILVIPEGSNLQSSMDNFHALEKEASKADKELVIESADSSIEELAESAGLKSFNPIFGSEERMVMDVIPRGRVSKSKKEKEKKRTKDDEKLEEFFKKDKPKKRKKKKKKSKKRKKKLKNLIPSFSVPSFSLSSLKPSFNIFSLKWLRKSRKRWLGALVGLTLVVAVFYILFGVLPRASAVVTLKKTTLEVDESVEVNVDVNSPDFGGTSEQITLPGEIATASQNLTQTYPASGEERDVTRRATGEVIIYNEAVTYPVNLVATTRFRRSDGKVYTLDEKTTVPAAEESNGSMIPGQVEVSVTASEPGSEYNINPGPDETWYLPGFEENNLMDLYNGVYGKPAGEFNGGYIGRTVAPTESDIDEAEQNTRAALFDSLINRLMVVNSEDLELIEGATQFTMEDLDTNPEVNEAGEFSVFANGTMRGMLFAKQDLIDTLVQKLSDVEYKTKVVSNELSFDDVSVDWDDGVMTFNVSGELTVMPDIDKEQVKKNILGKDEETLRNTVTSVAGFDSAKIELWPFWVSEVPNNMNKVKLEFN